MKILIITENYKFGGLETHIFEQAYFLKKNGHEIFFIVGLNSRKSFLEDVFGKNIYDIEMNIGSNNANLALSEISRIIKKINPDFIHLHPFASVIFGGLVSILEKKKFAVTIHGPSSIYFYDNIIYTFYLKNIIKQASNVYCVSEELCTMIKDLEEKCNLSIMRNSVDIDKFSISTYRKNKNKFAIVSRLDADKIEGIKDFLKKMSNFSIDQKNVVDIFGIGVEQEDLKAWIFQEVSNNLIVNFKGHSDNINKISKNGYSAIVGMGRVVLEFCSMNIPVILTGYDGVKSIIDKKNFLNYAKENFSGRGHSTLGQDAFNKEIKQLYESEINKNFLLRNLVVKHFNQEINGKKYMKDIEKSSLMDSRDDRLEMKIEKLTEGKINLFSYDFLRKLFSEIDADLLKNQANNLFDIIEKNDFYKRELEFKKNATLHELVEENKKLKEEVQFMKNSKFWLLRNLYINMKIIIKKIFNYIFPKKIRKMVWKIFYYIRDFLKNNRKHKKDLKKILSKKGIKNIIIFPPLVEWNIPLFQRPQQIALHFAKRGDLVFYCTPNGKYDSTYGFKFLSDNIYLTNRFDLVDRINLNKIYVYYSTDLNVSFEEIESKLVNNKVIYEYVDEIHEDISGQELSNEYLNKHHKILRDERFFVIATAQKLIEDVKLVRKNNFALVTNGVDYDHFFDIKNDDFPVEMKEIIEKNKKIVGYYGALASWFDYDLIRKLAIERPDYEIVLIGHDYDGSLEKSNIKNIENVTTFGPIDYKKLPCYIKYFDISIIPFVINDITISTSPIKLFEYMAAGKPIVTTAMPECKKYESVFTGNDNDEFIQQIDRAIQIKKGDSYFKKLKNDALSNTWEQKVVEIRELIQMS